MLIRRAGVGLIALLLTSTGCNAPDKVEPGTFERTEKAVLEVEATGDLELSFRESVDLRIVVIRSHEKKVRFLSVGIVELRPINEKERFKVAFDLVGMYGGPGRFTIPAVKPPTSTLRPSPVTEDDPIGLSNALLLVLKLKDPSGPVDAQNLEDGHEFNEALDPCSVVVGDGENSGSLTCPRLRDPGGNVVKLRMTWKVNEA